MSINCSIFSIAQITLTWSYNITVNSTSDFTVGWNPILSLVRNDGYVGFNTTMPSQSLTQASADRSYASQDESAIILNTL